MTLVGRVADYLPYFIYAFEELGRIGLGKGRGKFALKEVSSSLTLFDNDDRESKDRCIYSGEEKVLTSNFRLHTFKDASAVAVNPRFSDAKLALNFLTPTRIVYNGHLIAKPEFHIIFRNLLRRLSLLSYFYCDGDPEETDFRGLIQKAEEVVTLRQDLHWHDWERYSSRQDTRMMLGGFMGTTTFAGALELFLPHLIMGQCLHVGKGTTFGLGKYNIGV